jgi:leucyl/phenylalanyl-tRNA--protein transferase
MELRRCIEEWVFPDPREADADGLLAYGGDLRSERLLSAYARGIFPWYDRDPILWFSPDPRWILEPSQIRVNRSLRRTLRAGPFEVRLDTAFDEVIKACARVPRPGQDGTWITPEMIDAYGELHRKGFAHSVEAFLEGDLVGGAYGVSLGRAFFGESMFAIEPDASKVAFVALVQQLEAWNFDLIDCQIHTDHLARFGAVAWPREHFLTRLTTALEALTRKGPWRLEKTATR